MTDPTAWVTRLAAEIAGPGEDPVPVDGTTVGALLRIAREVAHRTERLNAPLSTYVVGRCVAARVAAGTDEATAIAEVEEAISRLLSTSAPD
jgi:hypothetical protein